LQAPLSSARIDATAKGNIHLVKKCLDNP
jgi:hypothetical protein